MSVQYLSPQNIKQMLHIYVGLILKEMACYAERNEDNQPGPAIR